MILDNASIHKGTRTREVLEAAGIRLCFLPTASPELNPIEHAFAKLKQHLRRDQPRDPAALEAAIKAGAIAITPDDADGFFRGAGYRPVRQLHCKPL